MSQTFKVRSSEIKRFKDLLSRRVGVEPLSTLNENEAFRAKYNDYLIIGYKTGKIIATKEEATELMLEVLKELSQKYSKKITIGSDEAGKGEWLGPIVVSAVALTKEQSIELQARGIMDSKELTIPKIRSLAHFITGHNYPFDKVIITSARFNNLFDEIKDEQKTMNDIIAWGHATVIKKVFDNVHKDYAKMRIIIDEFDRLKTEERLSRVIDINKLEVIQQPRAEEYIAVAAASIIARNTREEYLDYQSDKLGKNLRAISPEDAIIDQDVYEYAKVSFLKKLLSTKYKIAFR